jgi:hypothetical protein
MKKSTIVYLLLFPILLFSQESEPSREQSIFEKKHEVIIYIIGITIWFNI